MTFSLLLWPQLHFAFAKFKRPDCTRLHLRVLKFSKFSGVACPRTPLVSRDFVAPNGRSHIANILNYATPGLTNKKRLGTPLVWVSWKLRPREINKEKRFKLVSILLSKMFYGHAMFIGGGSRYLSFPVYRCRVLWIQKLTLIWTTLKPLCL